MVAARHAVLFAIVLATVACDSATSPDVAAERPDLAGRPDLAVNCIGNGSTELVCRAALTCEGLSCSGPERDVTAAATWSVVGTSVRHVGGGRFAAAGTGAAAVSARVSSERLESRAIPVEVFPGAQPQEVYRMFGRVGHGQPSGGPFGQPTIDQPLNGVTIDIVSGLAAGRQAVSGRPGDARPGLPSFLTAPGEFEIMGVPLGALTIEARAPGRAPIRVDLTGPHFLPPIVIPR